jgi:hypothetical protein
MSSVVFSVLQDALVYFADLPLWMIMSLEVMPSEQQRLVNMYNMTKVCLKSHCRKYNT